MPRLLLRSRRFHAARVGRKTRLLVGAKRPTLTPASAIRKIADRHTSRLTTAIEAVLLGASADIAMGALEAAFARGDQSAAARIALAAFPAETLTELSEGDRLRLNIAEIRLADDRAPMTERILDVAEDSAAATRCAVRPTMPHPDSVHDTMTAYHSRGKWTLERQRFHDRIVADILGDVTESEAPTIYMTGGGPASGKTTMLQSGKVSVPSRQAAVHVDSDHIKSLLPEYNAMKAAGDNRAAMFVHEESSYLSKRIATEASLRRADIVLDVTGDGTVDHLARKLAPLRVEHHRVVAYYATNDVELAVKLSRDRFSKTGRFVPEEKIRETHAGVSRTLPEAVDIGLFDEVYLYDTNVKGQSRLVMSARGKTMTIHDEVLWERFLAKGR